MYAYIIIFNCVIHCEHLGLFAINEYLSVIQHIISIICINMYKDVNHYILDVYHYIIILRTLVR